MRFLESEKVLIVVLHYLEISTLKISKIISLIRANKEREAIILELKISDRKVCELINSFTYEFNSSRNKPCQSQAVTNVINKWLAEHSIKNKTRSNYTTKISQQRIDFLCNFVRQSKANRELTLSELKLKLELFTVSKSTISSYLVKNDLKCHVASKSILLSPDHIAARLAFVDEYINKPDDYWNDMVYTDEKPLQNYHDGRVLIRRSRSEDPNDPELRTIKDKTGRFMINLWGYMSVKGAGIVRIDTLDRFEYVKLIREMLPKISELHNGDFIWLQDNCSVHNAGVINSYLTTKRIRRIEFPPKSPDLNVIEHFWGLLQRNVFK